jgi:hypothetical protein
MYAARDGVSPKRAITIESMANLELKAGVVSLGTSRYAEASSGKHVARTLRSIHESCRDRCRPPFGSRSRVRFVASRAIENIIFIW